MLTYFLGELTIPIYINVGNSQEGSEYDSYHNVNLDQNPKKNERFHARALRVTAPGSAHLILTAGQDLAVRAHYVLR